MKRPIRIDGNLAFVPLTKGYEAVIDASDLHLVEGHNWRACVVLSTDGEIRAVYATRGGPRINGKQTTIRMHRVICATPYDSLTDHRDGDGLNNRRENLRTATNAQNQQNRKLSRRRAGRVKGIAWHKRDRCWRVEIKANGKPYYLGSFPCFGIAVRLVSEARARLHGKFARSA